MEKLYPYKNVIENKLGELPGADTTQLWSGMRSILDKEMPQKKERRFIGWFFTGNSLMLLVSMAILTSSGFAFIFLKSESTSRTSIAIVKNLSLLSVNETIPNKEKNVNISVKSKKSFSKLKKAKTTSSITAKRNYNKQTSAKNIYTKSKINRQTKNFSQLAQKRKPSVIAGNANRDANVQKTRVAGSTILFTHSIDRTETGFLSNKLAGLDSNMVVNTLSLKRLQLKRDSTTARNITKRNRHRGAYVGVMAGIDFSSVNFKSMQTGANKGVIAGYSFSRRLSIESGLFWNKKRYVSDGSYFRPKGYPLPSTTKILSIDGECQMYEWPVNVKLTVLDKKHSLFITSGVSSYYMKTESYEYAYLHNGLYGQSYYSYKNETKNWLSVINFSLGYTHQLGAIGSIRAEPYIKLPITDLGINNMPVVSTGFNIGFTRKLHK